MIDGIHSSFAALIYSAGAEDLRFSSTYVHSMLDLIPAYHEHVCRGDVSQCVPTRFAWSGGIRELLCERQRSDADEIATGFVRCSSLYVGELEAHKLCLMIQNVVRIDLIISSEVHSGLVKRKTSVNLYCASI